MKTGTEKEANVKNLEKLKSLSKSIEEMYKEVAAIGIDEGTRALDRGGTKEDVRMCLTLRAFLENLGKAAGACELVIDQINGRLENENRS